MLFTTLAPLDRFLNRVIMIRLTTRKDWLLIELNSIDRYI